MQGMQFIEAVEKRDMRKTKHQGFFVNAGEVERLGDKPVKLRRRRRPLDGDGAGIPVEAPASLTRGPGEVRHWGKHNKRPCIAQNL
jgi:hypothetical protein